MAPNSTTLEHGPAVHGCGLFVRPFASAHWWLALLLLGAAACSEDKEPSDDDDTSTESVTDNDDDDSDDDNEGSRKDAGGGMKGDSGGGTMRADGGRIDAGMSTGTKPDASGPDAGTNDDSSVAPSVGGACSRESLKAVVDQYFEALAAHDPAMAPFAPAVKLTENGEVVQLGEGLWENAGMVKFKRTAYDTEICSSVSEATIPEDDADIVIGLRLKTEDEQITEVETIIAREGEYLTPPSPEGLIRTADDDWETVLPPEERTTREFMETLIDKYFNEFPGGGCNFADDCTRYENGLSIASCTLFLSCANPDAPAPGMKARKVLDLEAGIAVGFTMFLEDYTDFHMFKIRDNKVVSAHTILNAADSSGWD